jgi:hypothetical protein
MIDPPLRLAKPRNAAAVGMVQRTVKRVPLSLMISTVSSALPPSAIQFRSSDLKVGMVAPGGRTTE